ncbi:MULTISPECIES: GNAT family N-acetyltransferase [Planococcus]|uniref:GNAT family N-acetyltransferase n=1 Tax=Planococcus TaxID=1372 RepID=UPI001F3A696C|nr:MULTISPECIES: GNAT family N-acetyltransferase [Planococcus]
MAVLIRKAVPKDAEQLASLMKQVEQSGLMLFDPGERKTTPEQLQQRLFSMGQESIVFVAEEGQQLMGYLFAIGEEIQRKQHSIHIAIGVSRRERGKGIGCQLFVAMEEWAKDKEIRRIELTVLEHNHAAIALYKKRGFVVEGLKRESIGIGGNYMNEWLMSKLL